MAAPQAPVLPYPPVPATMEGARTHIYKEHGKTRLPLFLFSPEAKNADERRAVVVFFHGSGSTAGSVYQFAGYARELAKHGVAAGGSAGAHIAVAAALFEGKFDDERDDLAVSARPDALVMFVPFSTTVQPIASAPRS